MPSRHQNIKTSLCARTKNGSVMPLFVIFRPVKKKLQLTVSFDHPVSIEFEIENPPVSHTLLIQGDILLRCSCYRGIIEENAQM